MPLPRPASPRVLLADLRAFTKQRSRHQWIAAFFAVAMPVVIIVGFYLDGQTNILPGEQIVYVENWPANRTDAEIVAQQKIDQAKKEAALKERQEQFKRLEKRLGME
ncbi:MAG TPA: hypothetical protein VGD10_11300 [Allosphingosinicella sp.]|uniref:hypothetical protein n=1 Tax=Allosphingosinicella sp. TaxID=2823234 RepID=UPI002ED8F93F